MRLSVPFRELCIDLSPANTAEVKKNYKGLEVVSLEESIWKNWSWWARVTLLYGGKNLGAQKRLSEDAKRRFLGDLAQTTGEEIYS